MFLISLNIFLQGGPVPAKVRLRDHPRPAWRIGRIMQHSCTRLNTHVYSLLHTYTYMYMYMCMYIHTCMHACMHKPKAGKHTDRQPTRRPEESTMKHTGNRVNDTRKQWTIQHPYTIDTSISGARHWHRKHHPYFALLFASALLRLKTLCLFVWTSWACDGKCLWAWCFRLLATCSKLQTLRGHGWAKLCAHLRSPITFYMITYNRFCMHPAIAWVCKYSTTEINDIIVWTTLNDLYLFYVLFLWVLFPPFCHPPFSVLTTCDMDPAMEAPPRILTTLTLTRLRYYAMLC